jgi:hypothetical protein
MTTQELNLLNELNDFSLVTFEGGCISWNQGLWTVSRTTEKAILIDDEWLPKSQIVSVSMVEKKKYNADSTFEIVIVPELTINAWFDKMNDNKRGKTYGY